MNVRVDTNAMQPQAEVRRREPFALAAFYLALAIMIFPVEADLLAAAFLQHRDGLVVKIAATCFAIVCTPFVLSWRRFHHERSKWKGLGYLIATGIILVINLLMLATMLFPRIQPSPPR